jgi:nicotinamide mononucleotide adenylyltransferase
MKIYKAMAKKPSSSSKTQYHMFVGRWQPLHIGHEWLFQQSLNDGHNVLICIRDVEVDMNNPFSSEEIKENIEKHYAELISQGRVKVIVIPDVNGICFGRGVGYDVIEYVPPNEIGKVSATDIRNNMKLSKEE